jgi:hypothetical protein
VHAVKVLLNCFLRIGLHLRGRVYSFVQLLLELLEVGFFHPFLVDCFHHFLLLHLTQKFPLILNQIAMGKGKIVDFCLLVFGFDLQIAEGLISLQNGLRFISHVNELLLLFSQNLCLVFENFVCFILQFFLSYTFLSQPFLLDLFA